MKKFLVLLFSSLLVLGACGNSDSSMKMILIRNQKQNRMILIKIKTSQRIKIKRKKIKKNLQMKRIKIAKNSHKNSKLTHKNNSRHNSRHNKRQHKNNKRNKTMSMIAQNTVTNIMLVTRFQLMTIGHQKKNNALNKVHNKVLKEMVMILIIHI